MPLWLGITIGAALCQTIRTTLQQKIRTQLSVDGANFVRYLYGAPLSIAALGWLISAAGWELPTLSPAFIALTACAGLAQIVATSLMIHAFSLCNYMVGTVYSKTETVFVALLATFIAGEPLGTESILGLGVCLTGVIAVNLRRGMADLPLLLRALKSRGAVYGLLSGLCFAIASGSIREASRLLEGDYLTRGLTVLACMNSLQVLMLGIWLLLRDRAQLHKVAVHWRSSVWVGLFSVLGSAGWALAMTLENAARVRAAGQIELVFTVIAARFILGEKPGRGDIAGCLLLGGGVILILLDPSEGPLLPVYWLLPVY